MASLLYLNLLPMVCSTEKSLGNAIQTNCRGDANYVGRLF